MAQGTATERRLNLLRGEQPRGWSPSPLDASAGTGAAARPCESAAHPTDPAALAAALVAKLEQAVLAAYSLLATLDDVTRRRAASGTHTPDAGEQTPRNVCAACHAGAALTPVPQRPTSGLSRREAQVLGLLAAGRSNRQIAQALYLSPRTVQRHVANAYLKIGAHNKADATAFALRRRLA